MGETDPAEVHLGFLETPEDGAFLTPEYFPSKAGGKPVWLDPELLPTTTQLECASCHHPMTFLLQLYSPIETRDDCFHRTIYVFFCNESNCSGSMSSRFKALRCQMPRRNSYYSFDPPPEDPPMDYTPSAPSRQCGALCMVCGGRAPNRCSGCKAAAYCSRAHQVRHWRDMGHKGECGTGAEAGGGSAQRNDWLLSEFEIVNEPEELSADGDTNDDEGHEEEDRLKDYEDAVRSLNAQRAKEGMAPLDKEDVPFDDAKVEKDAEFLRFQKRIKTSPQQIVRYVREVPDGALWVSSDNMPGVGAIPACQNCGSARCLEFQILPQALYYLKIELDWGLLSVYTCAGSCNVKDQDGSSANSTYLDEFVWQQSVSEKAAFKIPAST